MRRYRTIAAILVVICTVAGYTLRYTSPELIPALFLLILIPQIILMVIQCCEVSNDWRELKKAVTEDICETVEFVTEDDGVISYIPFVPTFRVMSVMLGINPDRAGPSFVVL